MDRRALKNLITKRSTIWTLSLCLTGALVLGGIAVVDNTRDSGEENVQVESERNELAYLDDHAGETEYLLSGEEGQTEDMAAASGNAVEDNGTAEDGSAADASVSDTSAEDANAADSGADAAAVNADGTTAEADGTTEADAVSEVYSDTVISEQALLDAGIAFSDAESLMWPSAGTILIDYSMDGSVYFPTLNQYKYNPALIIGSEAGNQVIASAKGIVESITVDEETGTTLVLNIGNGFKLTYGQLKEMAVAEGDIVEKGAVLGYVSEPTKYYSEEGSNLYFAMTQSEKAVDPVLYLE